MAITLEEDQLGTSEASKTILTCLRTYTRPEQNTILTEVVAEIIKERRNLIQSTKDQAETVEKETDELRNQLVNVNSKTIQSERT